MGVLIVRLPRIGWATGQAAKEATWLPKLAPHLPVEIPAQVAMGRPADGYPFDWSVCTWLPGENANGSIDDLDRAAVDLAAFVRALRKIDTTGAHPRPRGGRGAPLAELDRAVRRSVAQLGTRIDGPAALRSGRRRSTPRRGTARRCGYTATCCHVRQASHALEQVLADG